MSKTISFLSILLLVLAFAVTGQTVDPIAFSGQKPVTETQILWMPNSSASLYVTSSGYLRDSAGTRVAFDTAAYSVGAPGACSQSISIRTSGAIMPQSYASTALRMRATDPAQAGVQIYLAFRYRSPVGTDTGWVIQSRNRVWDTDSVRSTLTAPTLTTSYTSWWMNGFVSGQDVRVCVARTASGPGAGDTVVFNNNWFRAW